jgi:hypothetical protein
VQAPYLACLDIAGPGTFTGDWSSPALDWKMLASEVNYRNVSDVYLNNSAPSGRNLFGIDCSNAPGTTGATIHGDGVVNSFDIGVLVFTMFEDAPYDRLWSGSSNNYGQVVTVDQRPETQSRCNDGRTRAEWQVELYNQSYCPPSLDYSFRRQLRGPGADARRLSEGGDALDDEGADLVAFDSDGGGGSHDPDKGFVRSRFAGVNDMGSWHSFEFAPNIVPVIVELLINNVWVTGRAQLTNAPPPRDGSEVPISAEHFQVRWSRTLQQKRYAQSTPASDPFLPSELQRCKSIVSGATGTRSIIGDTLSVRQEGRGVPCPFWLYMWIPVEYSLVDYGRALAEAKAANDTSELLFVWAKRGSTAMTTTGGVVLDPAHEVEHTAYPPPPSSPPSPPAPPRLPPLPPVLPPSPPASPPAQVQAVVVAQDFSMAGSASETVVENLNARLEEIETTIRVFVRNLTRSDVTVLTNVEPLRNDSTPNATNATNAPASRRRLDEQAEECKNGARVSVSIRFETAVDGSVIELLQEEWPRLINTTKWDTTACADPIFDVEISPPDPTDDQESNQTVVVIVLSVGGGLVLCCCCTSLFVFCARRRQKKLPSNSKNNYERTPTTKERPQQVDKQPLPTTGIRWSAPRPLYYSVSVQGAN